MQGSLRFVEIARRGRENMMYPNFTSQSSPEPLPEPSSPAYRGRPWSFVLHRFAIVLGLLAATTASTALAQAHPTASRLADIQVGFDYSPYTKSDYGTTLRGYG